MSVSKKPAAGEALKQLTYLAAALKATVHSDGEDSQEWGVRIEASQVAQVFIVDPTLRQQLEAQVRNDETQAQFSISNNKGEHVKTIVSGAFDKVVNGDRRVKVLVK